jgi:hypothetical protein
MRRRCKDEGGTGAAAVTVVWVQVVVALALVLNWVAVPCAAQQCATAYNGTLASVDLQGVSGFQPTVALRVTVGLNPIIISSISLALDARTSPPLCLEFSSFRSSHAYARTKSTNHLQAGSTHTAPRPPVLQRRRVRIWRDGYTTTE